MSLRLLTGVVSAVSSEVSLGELKCTRGACSVKMQLSTTSEGKRSSSSFEGVFRDGGSKSVSLDSDTSFSDSPKRAVKW